LRNKIWVVQAEKYGKVGRAGQCGGGHDEYGVVQNF